MSEREDQAEAERAVAATINRLFGRSLYPDNPMPKWCREYATLFLAKLGEEGFHVSPLPDTRVPSKKRVISEDQG